MGKDKVGEKKLSKIWPGQATIMNKSVHMSQKNAPIVVHVHKWNWHIVRKQVSTVNLNNLYDWGG